MGMTAMQHRQAALWAKFKSVISDPEWVANSSMVTKLVRNLLSIFIPYQIFVPSPTECCHSVEFTSMITVIDPVI